jgi:4-amino-4-deoxy-L-arabinose transferase-like glycosyltransferase
MAFFIFSVGVNYLLAKRLFDRRLALLGMGLLLVCNLFWQFSLSGLPQMLMLFIFSCGNYAMLRAMEEKNLERPHTLWILLCGFAYGLLALTNSLTIWILLGALVFVAIHFKPRGRHAAVMLVVFLVMYSPFLVRNWMVSGSPLGISGYSLFGQILGTESAIMRVSDVSQLDFTKVVIGAFRAKVTSQLIGQFDRGYSHLGQIIVAPVFFLSLLHLFKKPETAAFRWYVLTAWLGALLGMLLFGLDMDIGPVQANNLHVLFLPLMVFYGLAFVLVLWTRLEIKVRLVRLAFLTSLYLLSCIPFVTTLLARNPGRVHWPPYVPPFIAILNSWTNENEIISSDMPWAVAWYADRKSLWLPSTVNDFVSFHDYNRLGARLSGLYLTPITGNERFISDIVKGEYREWAPFILRNVSSKDFPLRAVTALPIDNECIYYSDTDRWTEKVD